MAQTVVLSLALTQTGIERSIAAGLNDRPNQVTRDICDAFNSQALNLDFLNVLKPLAQPSAKIRLDQSLGRAHSVRGTIGFRLISIIAVLSGLIVPVVHYWPQIVQYMLEDFRTVAAFGMAGIAGGITMAVFVLAHSSKFLYAYRDLEDEFLTISVAMSIVWSVVFGLYGFFFGATFGTWDAWLRTGYWLLKCVSASVIGTVAGSAVGTLLVIADQFIDLRIGAFNTKSPSDPRRGMRMLRWAVLLVSLFGLGYLAVHFWPAIVASFKSIFHFAVLLPLPLMSVLRSFQPKNNPDNSAPSRFAAAA